MSRWVQERFPWGFEDEPVSLPTTTEHGSLRAYNFYGCRCWRCKARRRSYDREHAELKNLNQRNKRKEQQ